jgi:cytochrome oxidase assembly protein ShyY1
MYRFLLRPKWLLFHLGILLLVVVMINLALWQLRRMDERKEFNAEVDARQSELPRPVEDLVPAGADVDPDDLQWFNVSATGTYLSEEQVLVVNVSQDGVAGVDPVVPLQLADGRLLLVNRGFVPNNVAVPPPPEGVVRIDAGRLRPSQKRGTGSLSDPAEGELTEVHRVDIKRLQQQLDAPVLPMYVDLLRSTPGEPAELVPVAAPDLSEGPHLGYAVQWCIFSLAAVIGWVLAVRRSVRTRAAGKAEVTREAEVTPV